jgi:hypothetical protein
MGRQTNVHDEERNGWPFVVSDDLVQSEIRCFSISELLCVFPQISHTLLYKITIAKLGYHKFCARWVPKMLTGVHKTQTMALTSLE